MAHICTARQSWHAEVNFVLVSMGDDDTRSHSIRIGSTIYRLLLSYDS